MKDDITSNETANKKSMNSLDKITKGVHQSKKQAYRHTVDIKDLRQQKENEKRRKSLLIYGTEDMKTKKTKSFNGNLHFQVVSRERLGINLNKFKQTEINLNKLK